MSSARLQVKAVVRAASLIVSNTGLKDVSNGIITDTRLISGRSLGTLKTDGIKTIRRAPSS
jgi:hypothetical protein